MSEPSPTPAADTAAEPFYVSARGYRNVKSVLLLIIVPLFAVFPTWAVLHGPRQIGWGSWLFALVTALALLAGFAKLVYNVATNLRQPVRIDTAGVLLASGRFLPWNEIAALRWDRGPFARGGYLACASTAEPTLFRPVFGQRSLSVEEAAQLLERIGRFLAKVHPRVKVGLPRPQSSPPAAS
jgi:hypothetical protein